VCVCVCVCMCVCVCVCVCVCTPNYTAILYSLWVVVSIGVSHYYTHYYSILLTTPHYYSLVTTPHYSIVLTTILTTPPSVLTSSSRLTVFLQLIILELKEEVVGELQSSWTSCRKSDTDTHSGMVLLNPGPDRDRTGTRPAQDRDTTGTGLTGPGRSILRHKRRRKPGEALLW